MDEEERMLKTTLYRTIGGHRTTPFLGHKRS
jgi:hypothetical protein